MYTVVRGYMENPKRITYHVEAVKSDTSEFIVHAMKVCGAGCRGGGVLLCRILQ